MNGTVEPGLPHELAATRTSDRTICLCMIVRNEAHVIRRALESARPHVDTWVICDTGSTDGTPEVIREALADLPGELHRVPWVSFGHNRTEVLRLARRRADYCLIMDADMVLNVGAPFRYRLAADAYEVRYTGELDYSQRMLVSSAHDWRFVGVTHEYIHADTPLTIGSLPEATLTHFGDGGMRADKFERDVRLLTEALAKDPDNPRDTFYLAQSYRDLGRYAEALDGYERRAAMKGWDEERWYARFQAARMRGALGEPRPAVQVALAEAYAQRPWRLEPLHEIVRHLREAGDYAQAYAWSGFVGHGIRYPSEDTLFIDRPVYDYLLHLEYGIAAYGTGRVSEAVAAFNRVLRQPVLPDWTVESALRGRRMALNDLHPRRPWNADERNRIVVVCGFHDAGDHLRRCMDALRAQDYARFRVLCIDDASTDGCARHVPVDDPRFRLVRNRRRRGPAAGLHAAIRRYCRPTDVVAVVDGDDWLARDDALSRVNEAYAQHDCWVLYSQFRCADGSRGFCEPFAAPRDVVLHRGDWRTSHLKTFRAGLFHAVAAQDAAYACLKDEDGRWLTAAVDVALMTPLVEMAGWHRVRFLDETLYVHDDETPRRHHHLDRAARKRALEAVRSKRPFAPVRELTIALDAPEAGAIPPRGPREAALQAFLRRAALLGHDLDDVRSGAEVERLFTIPTELEARRLLSVATPAQRRARQTTFFNPPVAARRRLGQGRHDRGEALVFADGEIPEHDELGLSNHLPLHARAVSVLRKHVPAGGTWDVSLRGDPWGLDGLEELYTTVNVGELVLEPGARVVVRGNVFSLVCQRLVSRGGAPGTPDESRICVLPTPFSVDSRSGPDDGADGARGAAGERGADGRIVHVQNTLLGHLRTGGAGEGEMHGAAGAAGGGGLAGGHGRNGGMCKLAEITLRAVEGRVTVFAQAGAGGRGGGGGDGGAGGEGGDGSRGWRLVEGLLPGGRGGDGGDGGHGGRGGNAGSGGLASNVYVCVPEEARAQVACVSLRSPGGEPGAGGGGGRGGTGGRGGEGPAPGAGGVEGRAGAPGQPGVRGRPRPGPWMFLNEKVEAMDPVDA